MLGLNHTPKGFTYSKLQEVFNIKRWATRVKQVSHKPRGVYIEKKKAELIYFRPVFNRRQNLKPYTSKPKTNPMLLHSLHAIFIISNLILDIFNTKSIWTDFSHDSSTSSNSNLGDFYNCLKSSCSIYVFIHSFSLPFILYGVAGKLASIPGDFEERQGTPFSSVTVDHTLWAIWKRWLAYYVFKHVGGNTS